MHSFSLSDTMLFRGTTAEEAQAMLSCLGFHEKTYEKDSVIFRAGSCVDSMGLVLSGSVTMETDDLWGNKTILGRVETGGSFCRNLRVCARRAAYGQRGFL